MSKRTPIQILRVIMAMVAVVCALVFVPWDIVWAWLAPMPETIAAQVDEAPQHGLDGIIVYVDQAGQPPQGYAAGWKDRDARLSADPQALFKIASISKLYIAAATAKLVAAQQLSLDRTLAEYLPDMAGKIVNADRVTLRQMVQHRSGLPNYSDHPDYPWGEPYKDNRGPLELVVQMPADFEPGTDYRYSNTNYWLLGQILDATLGYSHHRYIKEQILDPLGLAHTYSLLSEVDLDKMMSGYFVGYGPAITTNDFIHPGGSMVATAEDVAVFLRALNDGTLLNEEEQAIYSSLYEYEHTGLLPGYSSIARYHRDIDAVVVQFVNTNGGHTWTITEIIYSRILKLLRRQAGG